MPCKKPALTLQHIIMTYSLIVGKLNVLFYKTHKNRHDNICFIYFCNLFGYADSTNTIIIIIVLSAILH